MASTTSENENEKGEEEERLNKKLCKIYRSTDPISTSSPSPPISPVVMLRVGPEQRLFAAHEAILRGSPVFADQCQSQTPSPSSKALPHIQQPGKRIDLPDEQPEVLSCVLEFLYKGDYYPRLRHNPRRRAWELEESTMDGDGQSLGATVWHHQVREVILRDTAI